MAAGPDDAAGMVLRAMLPEDLDQVLVNETRSFAYPWSRGNFADSLAAGHFCVVLVEGAAVRGHGVLSAAAGEAHLLNVCVSRDLRGQGLGRRLVDHLLAEAERLGVDVVFLEVRPSNRVAIALYETLGFCELGRRPNYYPAHSGYEDGLVMALQWLPDGPGFERMPGS